MKSIELHAISVFEFNFHLFYNRTNNKSRERNEVERPDEHGIDPVAPAGMCEKKNCVQNLCAPCGQQKQS